MTDVHPQRFGRYLLIDRISAGGMAEVFLAKAGGAQGFEKILAIKRILPVVAEDIDFQTMFVDEAQISARLNHANIGQIFEFGEIDGTYFITMEYIAGQDLRSLKKLMIDRGEMLPVALTMHIMGRVCQALDYAHRQKSPEGKPLEIVHRDVSPPNVLLSYQGEVKLIDFGIARAASRATRTRAGKLKGKFAYMSPEQVDGRSIDHRSDIFSVGIVLYEMLTTRRPFEGATQMETLNLVRRAEPDPPSTVNPEVPLELDRIVMKALAKDPEQRYHWASELRADLERFFARTDTIFESHHLGDWMKEAFAEQIEEHRQLLITVNSLKVDDFSDSMAAPLIEDAETAAAPLSASGEVQTSAIPLAPSSLAADLPTSDVIPVASGEIGLDQAWPEQTDGAMPRPSGLDQLDEDELDPLGDDLDAVGPDALTGESTAISARPPADSETQQWQTPDAGIAVDVDEIHDTAPKYQVDQEELEELEDEELEEFPAVGDGTDEVTLAAPAEASGEAPFGDDYHDQDDDDEDHGMPTRIDSAPRGIQDQQRALGQPPGQPPGLPPGQVGVISAGAAGERIVGGGIDVDSDPSVAMPAQPESFSNTDRFARTEANTSGGPLTSVRRFLSRLEGPQLIGLVSGATLLFVGLIVLIAMTCGGEEEIPIHDPAHTGQATGSLVITTRPPADCVVSFRGLKPRLLSAGRSLSIRGANAGRYRVKVNCAGFMLYRHTITVRPTKVTFLEAKLTRQ